MSIPRIMVYEYQNTGGDEDGLGEFDPGEAAQVLVVEDVAADAESGQCEG